MTHTKQLLYILKHVKTSQEGKLCDAAQETSYTINKTWTDVTGKQMITKTIDMQDTTLSSYLHIAAASMKTFKPRHL